MSVFRYYLSPTPYTPSPPLPELAELFADNLEGAIEKIRRKQTLPPEWPAVWLHVLVWTGSAALGFESTRLR